MKISIILPTFNRSSILKKTIKNIQNQTFEDYELIIINDASNDETVSVVNQFIAEDNRIKLINNKENLGCARSRKLGLNASAGKMIVLIDDDDHWDNNKLKKQYNSIISNDSDMVISDYYIDNHKSKIYKKMDVFSDNFKSEILKRPGPFFQSIMIKKNIIDKVHTPFNPQSVPSEDWNFFIELSKLNPSISYINEPLFTWNIHNNNQSLNFTKEATALEYIINKHYSYIKKEQGNKIIANHYRSIARIYEHTSHNNNIRKYYIKAFKTHPLSIKNIFYFILMMLGYKYSKIIINYVKRLRGYSTYDYIKHIKDYSNE